MAQLMRGTHWNGLPPPERETAPAACAMRLRGQVQVHSEFNALWCSRCVACSNAASRDVFRKNRCKNSQQEGIHLIGPGAVVDPVAPFSFSGWASQCAHLLEADSYCDVSYVSKSKMRGCLQFSEPVNNMKL
jgi:hypothetical protein